MVTRNLIYHSFIKILKAMWYSKCTVSYQILESRKKFSLSRRLSPLYSFIFPEGRALCILCKETFLSDNEFANHLLSVHRSICKTRLESEILQCHMWKRKLSSLHCLQLHMECCIRRFTCDYCNKKCDNTIDLTSHINLKHKHKYYPCDKCDRIFRSPQRFRYYKKYHRNYTCCNEFFTSFIAFKIHQRNHHGQGVTCNDCNQKFRNKSRL